MFPKILKTFVQVSRRSHTEFVKYASNRAITKTNQEDKEINVMDTHLLNTNIDSGIIREKQRSVLEQCEEDISHVAPYLQPTFNFAAYVNKSETLQELLKMGVNLYKIEKIKDAARYILGLSFENGMKNYILFFYNLGLSVDVIASIITKNPFIFKEDIENLEVRINYLKYKKFTDKMILRMIEKNPFLLSNDTQSIDKKLGFIKKNFLLTANELRTVVSSAPKIITYNQDHIRTNTFVVKEEMGFTEEQTKSIFLQCPVIFMKNQNFILKTFEYLHNEMNIDLETIAKVPDVLTCRHYRLKQRHLFLVHLGKVQFDPTQPNYISLISLVSGTDSDFCTDIAKSSIQIYNAFLKTI